MILVHTVARVIDCPAVQARQGANLFTFTNDETMVLTLTTAVLVVWKNVKAGSQTELKVWSTNELSRTISEETATSVHTRVFCTALIVHCRNDNAALVPKNRPPLGFENDDVVEVISGGCTSPKTATSMTGSEDSAENNAPVLVGGSAGFVKMNLASAIAMLTSLMDLKYSKTTWSRLLSVPKRRGSVVKAVMSVEFVRGKVLSTCPE